MTLPCEEKRTLLETHKWLRELACSYLKDIKPREVREMAFRLLRHYPLEYHLDKMYEARGVEIDCGNS